MILQVAVAEQVLRRRFCPSVPALAHAVGACCLFVVVF